MPAGVVECEHRSTTSTPLGPGGEPFRGLRPLSLLLATAAVLVNAVIMLSDRAPGFLKRLSERIDVGSSRAARVASEVRLPQSDVEIHVAVWALAMLLVGLGMWSWRSLKAATVFMFGASLLIEIAQQRLTHSRSIQVADVVANVVGIALGVAGVVAVAAAWSATQWLWHRGGIR